MNQSLKKILRPAGHPNEAVDLEKLYRYTSFYPLSYLAQVDCGKLKELYVLGTEKISRHNTDYFPEAGCYLDPSLSWMLVTAAPERQIAMLLSRCGAGLELLQIRYLEEIERLDLSNLTGLVSLEISMCPGLEKVVGLELLRGLQDAVLRFEGMCDLSAAENWPELRSLDCSGSGNLTSIDGVEQLRRLEYLDLSLTKAEGTLHLDQMQELKRVNLYHTLISCIELTHPLPGLEFLDAGKSMLEDAQFLRYLANAKKINLYRTPVHRIPSLEMLCELEDFNLSCTEVSSLEDVRFPGSLKKLDLAFMNLDALPDQIGELKQLEMLDLRHSKLGALPEWLAELGLDFLRGSHSQRGILLDGTVFKGVDMSIFDQPQELIRKWFEARQAQGAATPLNEVKVVFLGDGEAGKSRTIARLMADGENPVDFDGNATPGIAISDRNFTLADGRTIRVHFWDFGGQEILHSMHRMFLTGRTVYVVVLNVRDNLQNERARYWLHNIKSFADGSPVLMVLNKTDLNPNASVNERDLRMLYPGLTEVVRMSALTDSRKSFEGHLTAALKRQLGELSYLDSPFLPSWNRLKDRLLHLRESHITGSDYRRLCREAGVEDSPELQRDLLRWFHDLGVCFYCDEEQSEGLEEHVVLRPEWITNAIYVILYNRFDAVRNGIVSRADITRMLCSRKLGDQTIRRVRPEEKYDESDTRYVLKVLEHFRLCYSVDEERVFIPMLCDRNSRSVASEYAADPQTLEFRLEYEYLPNNVLHRLMVERREDLDMEQVWLTGARFVWGDTGLSAVVECGERLLKLYVRSERSGLTPSAYLCVLLESIDRINKSLGLSRPVKQIVRKADGESECFDYEMMTSCLEREMTEYYSRARGDMVPIAEILGPVGFDGLLEKEKLYCALQLACQQMVAEYIPLFEREDLCVEWIRDWLGAHGFVARDHFLMGMPWRQQEATTVDLAVRNQAGRIYAVGDVMALGLGRRKSLSDLRGHVYRVLRWFDDIGSISAFQICFVRNDRADFEQTWHKCREVLREELSGELVLEIEDSVSPEDRPDRNSLRTVQFIRRGEGVQNLYLILVRMGHDSGE